MESARIIVSEASSKMEHELYKIWTDGSCLGNPGPGGWAGVITKLGDDKNKIITGSSRWTSNNRMELTAVLQSLRNLPSKSKAIIFSDSTYVVNGGNKWVYRWNSRNWKNCKDVRVSNCNLWRSILDQIQRHAYIVFNWVKGHNNDTYNELANSLAQERAKEIKRREASKTKSRNSLNHS